MTERRARLYVMLGFAVAMLLAVVAMLAGVITKARAHDMWIRNGGYSVPVAAPAYTGPESCCGENDCTVVDPDDVKFLGRSYLIRSLREVIPLSEIKDSPDGQYWRCQNNSTGKRKCFFAPPGMS